MNEEPVLAGDGVVGVPDTAEAGPVVARRRPGRPRGTRAERKREREREREFAVKGSHDWKLHDGDYRLERIAPISVDRVSYDTLTDDERMYVEHRVQGKRPLECVRLMAMKRGEKTTGTILDKRARNHEQRLRHLVADWREAQGMTDVAFGAWSERQVVNMAQEGSGASKLAALEWLEKRRQERKYADPDQLRRTLEDNLRELAELDRLEAVAAVGGAELVPEAGAPVDAGKQVSEPA